MLGKENYMSRISPLKTWGQGKDLAPGFDAKFMTFRKRQSGARGVLSILKRRKGESFKSHIARFLAVV